MPRPGAKAMEPDFPFHLTAGSRCLLNMFTMKHYLRVGFVHTVHVISLFEKTPRPARSPPRAVAPHIILRLSNCSVVRSAASSTCHLDHSQINVFVWCQKGHKRSESSPFFFIRPLIFFVHSCVFSFFFPDPWKSCP